MNNSELYEYLEARNKQWDEKPLTIQEKMILLKHDIYEYYAEYGSIEARISDSLIKIYEIIQIQQGEIQHLQNELNKKEK